MVCSFHITFTCYLLHFKRQTLFGGDRKNDSLFCMVDINSVEIMGSNTYQKKNTVLSYKTNFSNLLICLLMAIERTVKTVLALGDPKWPTF